MQMSEIIASIAVLISIFSLWIQNSSSRKQLMLSNFSDYTKRYQEIIIHFPKEVIEDSFNIDSFSEEEKEKILRYMWIYFDLCHEEFSLYKLGFIDSTLWSVWESGMQSAFSRPSFQICWGLISSNTNYKFHPSFVTFIEAKIQSKRLKYRQ